MSTPDSSDSNRRRGKEFLKNARRCHGHITQKINSLKIALNELWRNARDTMDSDDLERTEFNVMDLKLPASVLYLRSCVTSEISELKEKCESFMEEEAITSNEEKQLKRLLKDLESQLYRLQTGFDMKRKKSAKREPKMDLESLNDPSKLPDIFAGSPSSNGDGNAREISPQSFGKRSAEKGIRSGDKLERNQTVLQKVQGHYVYKQRTTKIDNPDEERYLRDKRESQNDEPNKAYKKSHYKYRSPNSWATGKPNQFTNLRSNRHMYSESSGYGQNGMGIKRQGTRLNGQWSYNNNELPKLESKVKSHWQKDNNHDDVRDNQRVMPEKKEDELSLPRMKTKMNLMGKGKLENNGIGLDRQNSMGWRPIGRTKTTLGFQFSCFPEPPPVPKNHRPDHH